MIRMQTRPGEGEPVTAPAITAPHLTAAGRGPRTSPEHPNRRSGGFTIMSPVPTRLWRQVVAADPGALPEQTPEWLAAICSTGPFQDVTRLYHFHDGRMFVLPAVRRTGLAGLGGSVLSYPAGWGVGGLVGADADQAVVDSVVADLEQLPQQRICIRPNPIVNGAWAAATASPITDPRRCYIVDLSGGTSAVEQRMPTTTRQDLLGAERHGVQVDISRGGVDLDRFYRLYLTSVGQRASRHHGPVHFAQWRGKQRDPLSRLQAMADHLGPSFVLALAQIDGEPVYGAIMLLGRTAHVIRRADDIDRADSRVAGTLVHRDLLQLACDEGCTRCHLGESGSSAASAQLSQGLGAVPYEGAEYRRERISYSRLDQAVRRIVNRPLVPHDH